MAIKINGKDLKARYINGKPVKYVMLNGKKIWEAGEEEDTGYYLTFSSPEAFTLATYNAAKNWDGVLEYSADKTTWSEWGGAAALSSGSGNKLYLRGVGNTVITRLSYRGFVLTGSNIGCSGNIETLLDYATVANGKHPVMADSCFCYLFANNDALISAPALPATTLTYQCYSSMFSGCKSLVAAPVLPATTLAKRCYAYMFYVCKSLAKAPRLPATVLADRCYMYMFAFCSSLTTLPRLPATSLSGSCYWSMFSNCSSLKLSAISDGVYQHEFRVPTSGTGTTDDGDELDDMFRNTGGPFTGTPEINTTYYTDHEPVG